MKEERKKRLIRLALWTWSWVGLLAVTKWGTGNLWQENSVFTGVLVALSILLGIMMLVANRRLFDHYDELERKIHLEAMAFTLGLTLVAGVGYSMLVKTAMLSGPTDMGLLVGFMGLTYLMAAFVNTKRYA